MSWSKSASGTAAEVKEQVKGWEKSVEETDRSYSASEDLVALHTEQARRCAALAAVFADATKDGYHVSATGGGHAAVATTQVMSDQWSVSLSTYKPAAAAGVGTGAAREITKEQFDSAAGGGTAG